MTYNMIIDENTVTEKRQTNEPDIVGVGERNWVCHLYGRSIDRVCR